MLKNKNRLMFGLLFLAGTSSLAGCIDYSPTPSAAPSTTTTESTTSQPALVPAPSTSSTTTTTQTSP